MKHQENTVTQVGCQVRSCTYHTKDHYCSAQHIDVENEKAERKAETFCATFAPKTDSMEG